MLRASLSLSVLLLPLMLSTGALAREAVGGTRRVDVSGQAEGTAPALAVAPGVITTLVFDTPLDVEALRQALDGLGSRFALADVGMSRLTLTLMPSRDFTPGARQRLEVRFAEGEEPRRAVLELVAGTKEAAERHVEVRRQRSSPEARVAELEARVAELETRGAACEAALEVARAWSAMPLAMLVLAKEVKPKQGRGDRPAIPRLREEDPGDVAVWEKEVYRTRARAVLALRLQLGPEARPWAAGGVVVRDARTGRSMRVHGAAMKPPVLEPGAEALWVVEWEAPAGEAGPVDVRVLEKEGSRQVHVEGVE